MTRQEVCSEYFVVSLLICFFLGKQRLKGQLINEQFKDCYHRKNVMIGIKVIFVS